MGSPGRARAQTRAPLSPTLVPVTPRRLDLACAGFVLFTAVGSMAMPRDLDFERDTDWVVLVLTVLAAAGVLVTRRWPVLASVVVLSCLMIYEWRTYPGGPLLFAGPLWLLLLGLIWQWRATALMGAALVGSLLAGRLASNRPDQFERLPLWVAVAVAAILAAELVKGRLEATRQRQLRAELATEQARTSERLRIAQDLHDSLGHALSLIVIQSRLARQQVGDGPGAEPLRDLTETTTRTMADLGGLLHGLRDGDALHRPVGSLEQLPALVDEARATGQQVRAELAEGLELPPAKATALYRVAQEALTNARRHGNQQPVLLRVQQVDGRAQLTVRNGRHPGTPATSGSGLGLVGMRERVEATGGTLTTGLRADGDWEVVASWPL